MNHRKIARTALVVGIVLVAILILLAVGAPMLGMIRAHLGM